MVYETPEEPPREKDSRISFSAMVFAYETHSSLRDSFARFAFRAGGWRRFPDSGILKESPKQAGMGPVHCAFHSEKAGWQPRTPTLTSQCPRPLGEDARGGAHSTPRCDHTSPGRRWPAPQARWVELPMRSFGSLRNLCAWDKAGGSPSGPRQPPERPLAL